MKAGHAARPRWARWVPSAALSVFCLVAVLQLQTHGRSELATWVEDWGIYEILVIIAVHFIGLFAGANGGARTGLWALLLGLGVGILCVVRAPTVAVVAPFLLFMAMRVPVEQSRVDVDEAVGSALKAILVRVPAVFAAVVGGFVFVGLIGGPPPAGASLSREAVQHIHMRMGFTAAAMIYFPLLEWSELRQSTHREKHDAR